MAFLGWLRDEPDHCSMAAIPTLEEVFSYEAVRDWNQNSLRALAEELRHRRREAYPAAIRSELGATVRHRTNV